jgi:hypothetical protein
MNAMQQAHLKLECAKWLNWGARPASAKAVVEGGAARNRRQELWDNITRVWSGSKKERAAAGGGGGEEAAAETRIALESVRGSEGAGHGKWYRHSVVNAREEGACCALLSVLCALGKMHAGLCVLGGVCVWALWLESARQSSKSDEWIELEVPNTATKACPPT